MQRAYAYLRVSGLGQVDGDGFDRQQLAIQRYAKANDIRIARWFREEGVSGTKDLENRPALSELIATLHGDSTKLVLIVRLDRLARDLMIQESIIGDFERKEFKLISVAEPDLCSNEPVRRLMRQMMGAFAEYERSMIVAKLKGARQRVKAKEGRCEGRKPYGTRPGEQAVLNRMQTLRAHGTAWNTIADILNSEGITTRTGKRRDGSECRWHATTVQQILKAQGV